MAACKEQRQGRGILKRPSWVQPWVQPGYKCPGNQKGEASHRKASQPLSRERGVSPILHTEARSPVQAWSFRRFKLHRSAPYRQVS
jgi:hypothetical protein